MGGAAWQGLHPQRCGGFARGWGPRGWLYRGLLWAIAAAIVVIVPTWAVQALTFDQVDAVASQVTVVIAQGLQKGDLEARQAWNPGSGVLVAHQGNTYYALTALHVVRTRGVVYGIRTSDGEVYFIDDEQNANNILPLGQEGDDLGSKIVGMDLALVKFTSDRPYPVAVMGNSGQLQAGDRLVVSGWPNPRDASARRTRLSASGQLSAILSAPTPDGGYSVLYDSPTQRGMSGGPVLNNDGELIGIHGRGRGEENGCAAEASCGMQTIHFLNAAATAEITLEYAKPPVDEKLIEAGLSGRPQADMIENIYDLFTFDVRSMLRDRPSGGCGSVLLGDRCD